MELKEMVGNNLEQEKIVYQNNGFVITEHPRIKTYDDELLNENDKVYRIKIIGTNQPTFDDICETLFYLLKNKIYDGAFLQYKGKVLDTILKAEKERSVNHNKLDNWM